MVNFINIKSLTPEEVAGIVSIYPWYAGARRELCDRLKSMDALTGEQLSEDALYFGSRLVIGKILDNNERSDFNDPDLQDTQEQSAAAVDEKPRIFVVGGDYFTRSQYSRAAREEDRIFSEFAKRGDGEHACAGEETEVKTDEIYTETLARIYLEQDYPEEAKNIYSKLSLRYPEKSVYFASLIEEIDKNN